MQPINLNLVEELTSGDPSFRTELIQTFISIFEEFPSEFENAVRNNDLEMLKFLIHKVKANLRMLDAEEPDRLVEETKELMERGSLGENEVRDRVTKVKALFEQVILELKALS